MGKIRGASKNLQALGLSEPHKLVHAVLPGQRTQVRAGCGVQGNLLKTARSGILGSPGQAALSLHPGLVPEQGVPSSSHWPLGDSPTALEPPLPREGGLEALGQHSLGQERRFPQLIPGTTSLLHGCLPEGHRAQNPRQVGQAG